MVNAIENQKLRVLTVFPREPIKRFCQIRSKREIIPFGNGTDIISNYGANRFPVPKQVKLNGSDLLQIPLSRQIAPYHISWDSLS